MKHRMEYPADKRRKLNPRPISPVEYPEDERRRWNPRRPLKKITALSFSESWKRPIDIQEQDNREKGRNYVADNSALHYVGDKVRVALLPGADVEGIKRVGGWIIAKDVSDNFSYVDDLNTKLKGFLSEPLTARQIKIVQDKVPGGWALGRYASMPTINRAINIGSTSFLTSMPKGITNLPSQSDRARRNAIRQTWTWTGEGDIGRRRGFHWDRRWTGPSGNSS